MRLCRPRRWTGCATGRGLEESGHEARCPPVDGILELEEDTSVGLKTDVTYGNSIIGEDDIFGALDDGFKVPDLLSGGLDTGKVSKCD